MSRTTKFWLVVIALLVAMQFFRQAKTNPIEDPSRTLAARTQIPTDVQHILNRSCSDCHSSNTRWPWYSNIAPASWIVIDDVNEGRRHMNMSDWASYDAPRAADRLKSICDDITSNDMPEASYRWVHRNANLSDQEKKAVCDWTAAERTKLASPTSTTH